jgi:phosphinothricin acetyltransferase
MASTLVRAAMRNDLPRLTEIYNYYIINTPITFDIEPYTIEERARWFDEHAGAGRHRLMVAEEAGSVIGFAGTGQWRNKAAYDTTVEMTVYCAPEATRRGIGTMLYTELFKTLEGEDIHRATAGITMPNDASVALHQRFSFVEVGIFTQNGRKFGCYWDVLWMERPMRRAGSG